MLARGVRIAPGAHVKNCIIMQDGQVHNDASIENAFWTSRRSSSAARGSSAGGVPDCYREECRHLTNESPESLTRFGFANRANMCYTIGAVCYFP